MRSPELMSRGDTALLVVDLQERLLPFIEDVDRVLARCEFLLRCARVLEVPIFMTEQYPKGLGKTAPRIAALASEPIDKLTFSAAGAAGLLEGLGRSGVSKVLVCGIESHVCVMQTALDLMAQGYRTYLAADAAGSRHAEDKRWALERMAHAGVSLTSAEAAVFEWTEKAGDAKFKEISRCVKEADDSLRKGAPE